MAEETDEMKIQSLGSLTARLKDTMSYLLEHGYSPEELDEEITRAEERHRQAEAEKRQRARAKRAVSRF